MSFKAFVWAWDQPVPDGDYHHVLLALANIAPGREVRASIPYIAKQVRRSPRKVRAALDWLADATIITISERPGKTDQIRLNIPPEFQVYMPDEDDDLEAGVRGRPRKTPTPQPPKPPLNPCTPGADEPKEPSEPKVYVDAREPEPFDAWWSHYPRKTAKAEARQAFPRALSKLGGVTPLADLIEATDRFSEEVRDRPVDKIPHPATWLNGERWNDEPNSNRSASDDQPRLPANVDRGAAQHGSRVDAMLSGAQKAAARWRV